MSTNRKKLPKKTIFITNAGCGCIKSKLSHVIQPTSKPKFSSYQNPKPITRSSSSSSHRYGCLSVDDMSSSHHSEPETDPNPSKIPTPRRKVMDSVAVEKESDDPYEDFRHSMLQMILEEEIYSKNGLQELLNCFLELNSPYYHEIIVRAFTGIWNEVVCERAMMSSKKQ